MRMLAFLVALFLPLLAMADAAVTQPVSNPDFEFGVDAVKAKDWV